MSDSREVLALPCHDTASWEEDRTLFNLLANLNSLQEFTQLIASQTREGSSSLRARLERFSGLLVFLEKYCSEDERTVFFERTLPFITNAAARLKEREPASGIPFLRGQENASLVLGRQLVVSLLANAFLCTFPDHSPGHYKQEVKDEGEGEEKFYPFTFFGLYSRVQKSTKKTAAIAAKLKCLLTYFNRLSDHDKCDLNGTITFRRQVLPLNEVPSLDMWLASQHSLCNIIVDNNGSIEDSGSHTLQVDFANRFVSGSSLEGGCVQEEIRFSICPELLVARLVLEPLQDNEAVVITGAERFADYKGYGNSFEYIGEHVEQSDRDMFGNILTSIVAIDAVPFRKSLSPDQQYTEHYILRELNKAFAGFLCQHNRGDLSTALIALRVQSDSTQQLALSEAHPTPTPPLPISPDAYNNTRSTIPPQDPVTVTLSTTMSCGATEPLSTIEEALETPMSGETSGIVEPSSVKPHPSFVKPHPSKSAAMVDSTSLVSSLVNSIMRSGVEMASNTSMTTVNECSGGDNGDGGGGNEVEDYVNNISELILSSAMSLGEERQCVSRTSPPGKITAATATTKTVADKLINSLFADFSSELREKVSSDGTSRRTSTAAATHADIVARNIIADVLSQDGTVPISPPPSSPQTMGQPTSPAIEWQVHSYADKMADSILSGVLGSDSIAPPTAVKRYGESGKSSRSSSLTGQSITLHEFTDDLVEGVVREGLLVASLQSRGSGNYSGGGLEGGRGSAAEGEGWRTGREAEKSDVRVRELADHLVNDCIQSVLDGGSYREPSNKSKSEGHGSTCTSSTSTSSGVSVSVVTRRAESPLRLSAKPGLLRQTLEKPTKYLSLADTLSDHSNLYLSAPTSSRLSYAWSVASTRDEGSRPVSPTDMDRMALSFVGSVEEYCVMFAELIIRNAIADITGNKKYTSHVPIKALSRSQDTLFTNDDIHIPVPTTSTSSHTHTTTTTITDDNYDDDIQRHHVTRLNTFLSKLDEADPIGRSDIGDEEVGSEFTMMRSPEIHKVLLRLVATGNWGCGAFGGDPQLKSMLQWAAVSASGRPEMYYFPYHDKRMEQLALVTAHLNSKQWTVGQLLSAVVDFSKSNKTKDLFSHLLEQ